MSHQQQRVDQLAPALAEQIAASLLGLAFGTVEITVHQGRVVQIERRERLRLPEPARPLQDAADPSRN